jgi:hypothetical protein
MLRYRFTAILPIIAALLTLSLWFMARSDHETFIRSAGSEPGLVWTDYTPAPLQIAGALNAPVATFAYPMYHLLLEGATARELMRLLTGVILLWGYVGFVVDGRGVSVIPVRALRILCRTMGMLFAIFLLVVTIPMHHVSGIYVIAAVTWAVAIFLHFSPVPHVRARRWR